MEYGTIPAKDILWQSYQPPVFYVVSAMVGNLAMNMGIAISLIPKILQFVSCFYGILTIIVIYMILKKVPLSDFSRLLAFGVVCFLPRHIYMSAMHSNDTVSSLSVAICTYLLLVALERKFSYFYLIMLSIAITIAVFTKYTSYVVIPIILPILVAGFLRQIIIPRKKLVIICLLLIAIPLLFLSAYFYSNFKTYGNPLPWNNAMLAPSEIQPRAESGLSFFDFKPWKTIRTPVLAPWNIDSFWTLIYSRMWFDIEPKFLDYIDQNQEWWSNYFGWLRGEKKFPSIIQLSTSTRFTGSALIAMGLVPLLLVTIGAFRSILGKLGTSNEINREGVIGLQIFSVLLLFNAAGIIALALKSPVYSSVKAAYFMSSLPAFAVFLGLGVMSCEKYRIVRWVLTFAFGCLFVLVALHILDIAQSLGFRLGR